MDTYIIDFGLSNGDTVPKGDGYWRRSESMTSIDRPTYMRNVGLQADIKALGTLLGALFDDRSIEVSTASSFLLRFFGRLHHGDYNSKQYNISPSNTLYCRQLNKMVRTAISTNHSQQYATVVGLRDDIERLIHEMGAGTRN